MALREATFYTYEDPWRASAFCFAFTQLVVTFLVFIHTILACITFRLMKWYGWWIPFWDGGYWPRVSTHLNPWAPQNSTNFVFKTNWSSPRSERFLKRSCSDNSRSLKNEPIVCPRCHGVWNIMPSLSLKNALGATFKSGVPRYSDGGDSYPGKGSCEEAEARNEKTKAYGKADELDNMSKAESHDELCRSMSTSLEKLRRIVRQGKNCKIEKLEASQAVNRDEQGDGMDSFLLELSGSGSKNVCWKNDGQGKTRELNGRMESFCDPSYLPDEMQDESGASLGAEECLPSAEGNYDSKELANEVVRGLRDALHTERRKLGTLYAELEVERIASETAANEAMAMICRLQEDKATLRMQAAHYQRMAEEKAIHDEQAMELLKEILYKKEKENYVLEKEVKVIRARLGRDRRRLSRRRKGLEAVLHEHSRMSKDVEEALEGTGSSIQAIEFKGEKAMLPCSSSHGSEKQPFKRRKGVANHDSMEEQSDPQSPGKISGLWPLLGDNSCLWEPSLAAKLSDLVTFNGDHASFDSGAKNAYLQEGAIGDAEQKINEMSMIEQSSAEVVHSPHLEECMHGTVAWKRGPVGKPMDRSQVASLDHFCGVGRFHQSESLLGHEGEENLCPNKRTSKEFGPLSPCHFKDTVRLTSPGMSVRNGLHGMGTNIALSPTNSPQLWHFPSAEFLQSSLHEKDFAMKDDLRRDFQESLQVQESKRTPPSSEH